MSESRPLHLHTLDSLIADLVSGRPVVTQDGSAIELSDPRARSALEWYRKKGISTWAANVSSAAGEDLVNALLQDPPELRALPARPANANGRLLRLKKLKAHRFAGLHKFGTLDTPPEDYVHEFTSTLTLFEGRNGSGKTSLLNAIIWALTGELLRAQRGPEQPEDFECEIAPSEAGSDDTLHRLSSITPMPNVDQYRPDKPWVPADTWVELTFVDEAGADLPIIRRSITRSAQGKLKETEPDLSILQVDPIAIRIGTTMPGLLPVLKLGSESELGRAVAELTGLAALVELADHVRRAKTKIDKEFINAKNTELQRVDANYGTAKADLEQIVAKNAYIKLPQEIPPPSGKETIEHALEAVQKYLEGAKSTAFESARDILSQQFDPSNAALLSDLERNIGRALERAQPQELPAAVRLGALRALKKNEIKTAREKIRTVLDEAQTLDDLAKNPSTAGRTRLYARVAVWIADHPDPTRSDDFCIVCGGSLDGAVDPVTGKAVKAHLHEAESEAALLSQTLKRWAENVQSDLARNLPGALRAEMDTDLPDHPCDLLRVAFVDELFGYEPFRGVLAQLKISMAAAFDKVVADCAPVVTPLRIALPGGCEELAKVLARIDHAIRFADWRQSNDALAKDLMTQVMGRPPKEGEGTEKLTLTGKLLDLEATVKAAKPISDALVQCGRLKSHLATRREAQKKLDDYAIAIGALEKLGSLGKLADEQVDELRKTLRQDAARWRKRIYLGAFPSTANELVDAAMGRKGELALSVQAGGVSAPAQHVTNASALRASLVAFFLAFWEYVLKERGGLTTLLLDDPQELLDDENRERLAGALSHLVSVKAQLIITSYDPRFCSRVNRLLVPGGIEHLEVHPATQQQPRLRTTSSLPEIVKRKRQFDANKDAEEAARNFADGCRVFFEAKLGDLFEDPAHSAWAKTNPDPTLATFVQRLRPLVRSSPQGMFSAHVFRRFVDHSALVDGSPVLTLMNKSHHGRREEIRAGDVAECADALNELLELVEQMYEEGYRWRRRDALEADSLVEAAGPLVPMEAPRLNVLVCPDLAAFTDHRREGQSQESVETLNSQLLSNAVAYYLRRPNFGFAAPAGAIALVESTPGPAADRRLVIARHGEAVYARRFVRGTATGVIGLTAEVPDPRTRTPKTIFVPESEVAVHQVVGILFDHSIIVPQGRDEAVIVDVGRELRRVEVAFRVVDESAVPLALAKQVVLGGRIIELDRLGSHSEALVALTLDDGSSIFKRIGEALPNDLSHLRQFESIGGLGSSEVLSVGRTHKGFRQVYRARVIIGVLYHG